MGFPFSLYRKYILKKMKIYNPSVFPTESQLHTCLHVYTREPKARQFLIVKSKYKDFFTGHLAKLKFAIRLPCVKGAVSER